MSEELGVNMSCQTEIGWKPQKQRKYRSMKRKIVKLMAKEKEVIGILEALDTKIKQQSKDQPIPVTEEMSSEEEEEEEEEEEFMPRRKRTQRFTNNVARAMPKIKKNVIETNEDGTVVLPVTIGQMKITDLGQVDYERSEFHNNRYIYPIGYTVERLFSSISDPSIQTVYTCTIVDGKTCPMFRLTSADSPDEPIEANSSSGVWCTLMEKVNRAKGKKGKIAVSGPVQYGLAHPLVRQMIEQLPNADKCKNYVKH